MPEPPDLLAVFARLPSDVLSLLLPDGTCRYVTPSIERTLGYTPEEYVALAGVEFIHPEDQVLVMTKWLELIEADGNECRVEFRARHRDGSWRWLDMVVSNHMDDPTANALVANFRDVTERRHLEVELRRSQDRLQRLLERAGEVFVVLDTEFSVAWASPAIANVLGLLPAEVEGRPVAEFVHPDDLAMAVERLTVLDGGAQVGENTILRVRHADGSWRHIEIDGTDMSDDAVLGGIVLSFQDITNEVEATRALRDSESRFRAVVTNSRDIITTLEIDGTITWCTDAALEMLGFSPDELVGTRAFDLIHPDDLEDALTAFATALANVTSDPPEPTTLRVRTADGPWASVEIAGVVVLDDSGNAESVVLNVRDVAWRIEAEEALRTSEERLKALIEHAPAVIDIMDADGVVQWVSSSSQRVFGHRPEEMVGATAASFVHPDDLPLAVDGFLEVLRHPAASIRFEVRMRRADTTYAMAEVVLVNRLDDPAVSGVVGNFRDISPQVAAAEASRASEERFRSLAECAPMGIYQQSADGTLVYVNERWQEITGLEATAVLGGRCDDILRPEGEGPTRIVRPGGEVRWVHTATAPLVSEAGEDQGTVGSVEDITERILAQKDSQRLTDIFDATQDLVGISNRDGDLIYLNTSARGFFGLPPHGGLEGRTVRNTFPEQMQAELREHVVPELERQDMWYGELRARRADGVEVPMLGQFLVHRDADTHHEFFAAILHDISERKDFEHRLRHQATHDPLTGLPNRTLLLDRLDRALARARRTGQSVAVLFLDLDNFKVVNDSLGHSLGDRLLQQLGHRLGALVRPGDTVARFGGDEFVVLCEDVGFTAGAIAIAERIIQTVTEPFLVDDTEVFVGTSVGIAFSDGSSDGEALIGDADAAMYRAKAKGRGRWETFDSAMRATMKDRLDIESALRRSLDRRELRVHFQPIVDVTSGGMAGVEALVRWEHPERGLLLPGDFISVAEETGLIVPIGAWVLEAACRQVQRWLADREAGTPLTLAVNISGRQLSHPRLVDQVRSILSDTHFDPSMLELEITESVLMDDVEMSNETLGQLKDLGVRLVVDDFGTGYSSLSYLRRFPVDGLKVDRSFVDGLGRDPSDSAIVAAVVNLAHTLGLDAVAEGVETAEQLVALRELGCDRAQGFFMARPQDGQGIERLRRAGTRW